MNGHERALLERLVEAVESIAHSLNTEPDGVECWTLGELVGRLHEWQWKIHEPIGYRQMVAERRADAEAARAAYRARQEGKA